MSCAFCQSQGHQWNSCPLFGKPEEFVKAFAPQFSALADAGVTAKRRHSLAPNIEEVFGRDKEQALHEVLDDPHTSPEEQMLALELLIGTKHMSKLDPQDQELVTSMNHRILFGAPRMPDTSQAQPKVKPRVPNTNNDPYSSVNYDFDRDPQNQPG